MNNELKPIVIDDTIQNIEYTGTELIINKVEQLGAYANFLCKNNLIPECFEKNPQIVFHALNVGKKLGLDVVNSMQSLYMVNGKITVWGDAIPALVHKCSLYDGEDYEFSGKFVWNGTPEEMKKNDLSCTFTCKRKDTDKPYSWTFGVEDMRAIEINRKNGLPAIWKTYTKKMFLNRARTTCYHNAFPEVFCGLYTVEEIQESPLQEIKGIKDLESFKNELKNVTTLED